MLTINNAILGFDCTFEMDQFNKPRIRYESETIANCVLFILFSKPGQLPSLPMIGLDIQSMLYSMYDDIDEKALEQSIISQCAALGQYFQDGSIQIKKMIYRTMPSLLIHVDVNTKGDESKLEISPFMMTSKKEFFIGISVNELNELLYNINTRTSMS